MSTPRADTPPVNWSDLGVMGFLPTGTVTLLLADVEGSTRLWESQPDEMTAAVARLDRTLNDVVAAHDGARPVEQGEGDSFVVAFARASDAVACALDLQRAPLAPIRLRIGVHTGEIQLRDEGNYIGPTINRTARLRDLAHGEQTVLSGTTHDLVVDRLPDAAWLIDLGSHPLRDLPRPERVVQLCHPDVRNEFPPLRTTKTAAVQTLPTQLTSFVGRGAEIAQVRALLNDNRLVTLTGAGGSGKTRLAVHVAAQVADDFDAIAYVDLAPITQPDLVAVAAARAFGLPDQTGLPATETLIRFVADRRLLVVLDNCEHLLDSSAALVESLLAGCGAVVILTTSREPLGVAGESTWRIPSMSLEREAIELFADRARKVRVEFAVTDENRPAVREICHLLDGMPLAIELAAARMRALSVDEIVDSLHDRFRLLTGGARTAVRRQQTLRASVDWSHALLTEPERVLFRRLAAFMGGFDLDAAQAVGGGGDVERYQVLDQLTLLVDKSLVVAETASGRTRYRLLETVRQYASEKLGESGEAAEVRTRHRDHFMALAVALDMPQGSDHERRLDQAEREIDNLRAAFRWSRESGDNPAALTLAAALQPLWLARGHIREGIAWLKVALAEGDRGDRTAERARALADRAMLLSWVEAGDADDTDTALEIAREIGDEALLARALIASGCVRGFNSIAAKPYYEEALVFARHADDAWRVSQILGWQAYGAMMLGDLPSAFEACREGREFADAIGDRFVSRQCRWCIGHVYLWHGDLDEAAAQFDEAAAEAEVANDLSWLCMNRASQSWPLVHQGKMAAAEATAETAIHVSAEIKGMPLGWAYWVAALAAFASGDAERAKEVDDVGLPLMEPQHEGAAAGWHLTAEIALARGDIDTARRWADDAVEATSYRPSHTVRALLARARVALAEGRPDQAEDWVHRALAEIIDSESHLYLAEVFECLADAAVAVGSATEAARLLGAADAERRRRGSMRFPIYDAAHTAVVDACRPALGDDAFDAAWTQGAALSVEKAVGYARRGRGERKRPSSGWASLTPTELDVARLVRDGLANKEIAARLFISPRTVQTHLTHIYTKLGIGSRVQLAQEMSRSDVS
jgi:predicted ATPase/class 3 adenylate cyclase/DNA-binding CsgD family transcriptional regulator